MTVNESRRRGDHEASGSSEIDNVHRDELTPSVLPEDDTRDGGVDDDVASAVEESERASRDDCGPRGASSDENSDDSGEGISEDPVLVVTRSSSPRTKCVSQPPPSPVNEDALATVCAPASQVSKTYTSAKVVIPYFGRVFDETTTS